MNLVKIISAAEFAADAEKFLSGGRDEPDRASSNRISTERTVNEITAAIRTEGDAALWRYTKLFEKEVPPQFEAPVEIAAQAWEDLKTSNPRLAASLELSADHIRRFGEIQKGQIKEFEAEIADGLFSGQRVIPVERAAIYVPAGRFPLISSALMCIIPAKAAGVSECILVSPPCEGGLPDRRILAAAYLAGADRYFALGGAQAIAAFALGTETVPRADFIAGPGNKYVAAAKRIMYGEVGIDFIAGPTDVLVISDKSAEKAADLIAADMLAQAEHDPDARARALVPDRAMAELIEKALEKRLTALPAAETARSSLEAGGLVIVYSSKQEALDIANRIAPEHLELQVSSPEEWIPGLRNYGSLFIGEAAAEALGDYSAGVNHTLPTSCSARFTGGLSVRHFLKTPTTLRCVPASGYAKAVDAAETIALAEGLTAHAESARLRRM